WSARRTRGSNPATSASRRTLRRSRRLADHLARLRIVFANRVLSDVYEPLAVYGHAVALGRIEGADDVAAFVDVNHRGRPLAAIAHWRIQLRFELDIRQVVGAIQHPDVVILIDGQARHASQLPLVGQGFGPIRVELEFGCDGLGRSAGDIQGRQTEAA